MSMTQEPVGLSNRRLQIDRAGPFYAGFLPHGTTMWRRIRQKTASAGPFFTIDDKSPTGCWAWTFMAACGLNHADGTEILNFVLSAPIHRG
jgi:hypothetical protein